VVLSVCCAILCGLNDINVNYMGKEGISNIDGLHDSCKRRSMVTDVYDSVLDFYTN